jgi:hypothetical protein
MVFAQPADWNDGLHRHRSGGARWNGPVVV